MTGEIILLTEPYLQFTVGKEGSFIDPRVGLLNTGPLDYNTGRRVSSFSSVNVGVIAKEGELVYVLRLLNDLKNNFKPKGRSSQAEYIGFEQIYKIPIDLPEKDDNNVAIIRNKDIKEILSGENVLENICHLYLSNIQRLVDSNPDFNVLVLQIPDDFERYFRYNHEDLRDHIKTMCVEKGIKTQILTQNALKPHDQCDNMWNLSLGLYVKAGGAPWKLRDAEEDMCFIGISFGIRRRGDGQSILVGLAEVFDEFGEHVTIKVVEAAYEADKGYHLDKKRAKDLIKLAIDGYKEEKKKIPKHIVVHKTSPFNDDEKLGIERAIGEQTIFDLIHIQSKTPLRLIPNGAYPPQRGVFWKIDQDRGVLYTVGVVEEFNTYPGAGTPQPIEINRNYGEFEVKALAEQVLGLTKMNWNTTSLMNREPITIDYARKVVGVLKAGRRIDGILRDFRYYI